MSTSTTAAAGATDATITVSHYLVSWYEDAIHECGLNQVDEYYVVFNDRGLAFNVNKRTKEQNVFFCDEGRRNMYSIGYHVKVHALIDEVQIPLELVQSCYEIAQLNERLDELKTSIKIPAVLPASKEELERLFTDASNVMIAGDLGKALEGFKKVLYYNPGHTESLYNCACVCSLRGNTEEALLWLQKLIDTGYSDVLHLITDVDLTAVRLLVGFKEILHKAYSQCNRIYRTPTFTEAQLKELCKYGINPQQP
jgi:tetratricopeptide (TPR) repeat protein